MKESHTTNQIINKGSLIMLPKTTTNFPTTTKPITSHKRASSTGTNGTTTTTDEEDDEEDEEFITQNNNSSSSSSIYSDSSMEKREECSNLEKIEEIKEQKLTKLQSELQKAHKELQIKDDEVGRLTRIRKDVELELEDLTASLFQEAHNMVREANEKQLTAEKQLKENQMKVDVLTAEVAALKTLVLTSTPSKPNLHLHPQIDPNVVTKQHRRSPSHFNLKYGRENSPPPSSQSPTKQFHYESIDNQENTCEVDPIVHLEFLEWRQSPNLNKTNPFIKRIFEEDINLCLVFNCEQTLSQMVREAIENGTILIEAISDKAKTIFPKKCALLQVLRLCFYRMNIGESDVWYCISQICRNRIIAVCDFLNYLKYIERGLVKSTAHDIYWEIVRLRKNMALARLGLNLNS